ncbi:MAG: GMC family oxidoreductase [Gammaproteobacteria bacterium]|nr:GMC family oxidoreductase [Gammaproteobacteria bacterium]
MKNRKINNDEHGLHPLSTERRTFIKRLLKTGVSLSLAVAASSSVHAGNVFKTTQDYTFDYIIVGAGSAGCVMAYRLTAAGFRVLLLEAGSDNTSSESVSDSRRWLENIGTERDWGWSTSEQSVLNNRSLTVPGGRTLGGGGSINAMIWLRPDKRDLNQLCRQVGHAWTTEELYEHYNAVENFGELSPNRSNSGMVTVNRFAQTNDLTPASISAAHELGIEAKEHNGSKYIDGAGVAEVNITPDGLRSGPAQTYLAEAIENPLLEIVTNTLVTKLDLDGGICRGVEGIVNGQSFNFRAGKEVIVSAGAVGSPKLLMLSGIGSYEELSNIGLACKNNLPAVGKHLQDHVLINGVTFAAGPHYDDKPTLGNIATNTFYSSKNHRAAPDIQIMCMQTPFPPGAIGSENGVSLLPWLAKPKSSGFVALKNSDPTSSTIINPGYLKRGDDFVTLRKALLLTLELARTQSFSGFLDTENSILDNLKGREKLDEFITNNAAPGIHLVGSCRLGTEARSSVVDPSFRIWGVEGLRVVDASVLPEVPGVNIQALIMTVAEKAAATILGDMHFTGPKNNV